MKAIGIQINSNEAIISVLEKDENGIISQLDTSRKIKLDDHFNQEQVKQFYTQIKVTFDSIGESKIAIYVRNPSAKGERASSPISFKLEGIIQLYCSEIQMIWPQTLTAFFKKNAMIIKPKFQYQEDSFRLAYYLLARE
jgi:hypothetical protein